MEMPLISDKCIGRLFRGMYYDNTEKETKTVYGRIIAVDQKGALIETHEGDIFHVQWHGGKFLTKEGE